jgi:hypothetical protein
MIRVSGQETATATGSITGGFILVPIASLMVAWRSVGVGDFRIWLACWEARARRQGLAAGRLANHSTLELASLCGITERRVKASLKRLVQARLVEWSAVAIRFPEQTFEIDDQIGDTIGRGRGTLAIPRRMLRFLADGARPALIAVVLGILLRCLSRRREGFDGRGRFKASWVARTFGISTVAVKVARRELVKLGWIVAEPGNQWAENRWGRTFHINLGWQSPGSTRPTGARSIPLPAETGARSIPPDLQTWNPSGRTEHQEPACSRPPGSGDCLSGPGKSGPRATQDVEVVASISVVPVLTPTIPVSAPVTKTDAVLPAPQLADIWTEDLTDIGRTLDLHRQAVAKGLVTSSEHDRLRFVALAEHARQVGRQNSCGLFAALLRRQAWSFITTSEEDAARRRLRAHLHGSSTPVGRVSAPVVPTSLPMARPAARDFTDGLSRPRPSFVAATQDDSEDRRAAMLRQLSVRFPRT